MRELDPLTLLAALRAKGLNVRQYAGWQTRGTEWAEGAPIGTMPHHTAPPLPYPLRDLSGVDTGRVKCNINIKADGTVWLVAFNACTYSSGSGSSVVVDEVRRGVVPPATARERGLADDTGGNRVFFNVEVDHAGDGRPQTPEAVAALALVHLTVADFYGYTDTAMASHAEFTGRKGDPAWNGGHAEALAQLRALVAQIKESDMQGPNGEPNWDEVSEWAQAGWTAAHAAGMLRDDTHPKDELDKEELFALLHRGGLIPTAVTGVLEETGNGNAE